MGHGSEASWLIDSVLRPAIHRHRRLARRSCLVAAAVAGLLVMGTGAGVLWGAWRAWGWLTDAAGPRLAALPEARLPGLPGNKLPRLEALPIPVEWEQQLGEAGLAQIRARSRFLTATAVSEPLARLAAPLLEGLANAPYRFQLFVADTPEINACALPGGYLVLNRGLLERVTTPAEIQGVVAHEMAHVLKRHGLVQLAQGLGIDLAGAVLRGGENPLVDALIRNGAEIVALRFTRDQERAADDLGWELLERAQLDPRGMVRFFVALRQDSVAPGSSRLGLEGLLRSHPTPQERIGRLEGRAVTLSERTYTSYESELTLLKAGLRADGDRRSAPDLAHTPETAR